MRRWREDIRFRRGGALLDPAEPLQISGTPVTAAYVGVPYDGFTAVATGGRAPYAYSLVGSGPTGLGVDEDTGELGGTPSGTPGVYADLVVRVTDADGATADLAPFPITLYGEITFVGMASASGTTTLSPTCLEGDLLLVADYRTNNTPSSLVAGQTPVLTRANTAGGGNQFSVRVSCKFAAVDNDTVASPDSTIRRHCLVYRGVDPANPVQAQGTPGNGVTSPAATPALSGLSPRALPVVGVASRANDATMALAAPLTQRLASNNVNGSFLVGDLAALAEAYGSQDVAFTPDITWLSWSVALAAAH